MNKTKLKALQSVMELMKEFGVLYLELDDGVKIQMLPPEAPFINPGEAVQEAPNLTKTAPWKIGEGIDV